MSLKFKTSKQINNFNKKYVLNETTGCWNWIGAHNDTGYGQFGINKKTQFAHRISYVNFKGPIPEGLVIDHRCKNRLCVNPEHLEAVTQAKNVQRGLSAGETHRLAKLNRELVAEIRYKYSTGLYIYKELGEEYKVDRTTIGEIIRNKHWK